MARVNLEPKKESPLVSLEALIPEYAAKKASFETLKKEVDIINTLIKQHMDTLGIDSCSMGGYTAKISTQQRVSFDEEILLDIVYAEYGDEIKGTIIKTKEYIDMEELEGAIYNGVVDAVHLKPAESIKEVVTLRISKDKEK